MRPIFLACLLIAGNAAFASPLDDAATGALLDKIAAMRAGRAVTAGFTERKFLPLMNDPIVESGTIAFEPPDKFLRRTGAGNLAVSDGKTLWMYYPAFAQVEIYPLDDARGPGGVFAMLTAVFKLDQPGRQFHVKAFSAGDGFRLELVPRSGSLRRLISSITLELDSGLRLRSSVMQGTDGDRVETVYSGEKFVADGSTDFTFTPPAGANVVQPLAR